MFDPYRDLLEWNPNPGMQAPNLLDRPKSLVRKGKHLRDTKDKLIQKVVFNFRTGDYDVFIDELRNIFDAYKPLLSIPLLRIIFISQESRLEGIVLKSNAYLLAVHNGYLFEFDKERRLFHNSYFLGFGDSYPAMGGERGILGLRVGYNLLRGAVEQIINDHHVPSLIQIDIRVEGWKRSLLIIIVMVLEGVRFKPLSLSFSRLSRLQDMVPTIGDGYVRRDPEKEREITEWMDYMIHRFSHMTKVANRLKPKQQYEDGKPDWIQDKCHDEDFCIKNLGMRNNGRILTYKEKRVPRRNKRVVWGKILRIKKGFIKGAKENNMYLI